MKTSQCYAGEESSYKEFTAKLKQTSQKGKERISEKVAEFSWIEEKANVNETKTIQPPWDGLSSEILGAWWDKTKRESVVPAMDQWFDGEIRPMYGGEVKTGMIKMKGRLRSIITVL
jgi:hypothetical protein